MSGSTPPNLADAGLGVPIKFVLHDASRPRNELLAWTINFQAPRVNLFLTADNETGAVTGRVFDENVKELRRIFSTRTSCAGGSRSGGAR